MHPFCKPQSFTNSNLYSIEIYLLYSLFTEDDYYQIIGEHKAKLLFLKHSNDEKSCREYAENLSLNTEGKDIQTLLREIKHTLLDRQLSF